jgi:hypothetical protein
MMDRRRFLIESGVKLAGVVAAAHAFQVVPVAAAGPSYSGLSQPLRDFDPATRPSVGRLRIREAGTYQVSGVVRLDASVVEISGITNAQQISWSGALGPGRPVASFTSFEQYSGPGLTPEIQVRGGHLESLSIVPMDYQ